MSILECVALQQGATAPEIMCIAFLEDYLGPSGEQRGTEATFISSNRITTPIWECVA